MKKMIIIFLSVFIAFSPLLTIGNFSFAESGGGGASGDAWLAVNDEATMVAAFKAYCRSRNFNKTFTFSNGAPSDLAKSIINYDYNDIEKLCALAGTDIDTVNAGLWYKVDQNNILKFFYTSAAMRLLNQLYSALLTEHNLQENEEKTIYSGKFFNDDNNNCCFLFIMKNTNVNSYNAVTVEDFNSHVLVGTPYRFRGSTHFDLANSGKTVNEYTLTYNNNTYTYYIRNNKNSAQYGSYDNCCFLATSSGLNQGYGYFFYADWTDTLGTYKTNNPSCVAIAFNENTNKFLLCSYYRGLYQNRQFWRLESLMEIGSLPVQNSSVKATQGDFSTPPENKSMEVTTDSDTINNYITNNNSNVTNNYYDDDDPPETPVYTNPYDDNPTGGTIDGNGNINFQMPDINIDWNLNLNTSNLPFPFSIPFDIIRFLTILDTEPEAPKYEIQTSILNNPIDFDIDLSVFDDGMEIIRNIILVGYILFLIISTRALFHIY